jgi:hypothetical protein
MARRWKIRFVVSAGAIAALLALFFWLKSPDLPPLLQNVTTTGGWWGACPPEGDGHQPLALSPELNWRLQDQFPPGTNEQQLLRALSDQGFTQIASCENDPTIHAAAFLQGNVRARVYWKSDDAGSIVWTKGFVFYVSL